MDESQALLLKIAVPTLTILGIFLKYFFQKKESKIPVTIDDPKIQITNVNTNNIEQILDKNSQSFRVATNPIKRIKFTNLEEAMKRAKILFIDDDKQYSHSKILKNNGWCNTSIITDLNSIDADHARTADIFFVDIHGVGKKMNFKDEGLGLSRALMEKYPEKYVVIYSSENNGDRFHEMIRKADYTLNKFADIYEFEKCLSRLLINDEE